MASFQRKCYSRPLEAVLRFTIERFDNFGGVGWRVGVGGKWWILLNPPLWCGLDNGNYRSQIPGSVGIQSQYIS